jgi:phage gpG-like protein
VSLVQMEVAASVASFRFNESEYARLLKGPVAADLVRRAIRVEALAKQYASGYGGGPNVRTGRLRASITWRLASDGSYVDVGSAVAYAPMVELGTSRQSARPYLRPALSAART